MDNFFFNRCIFHKIKLKIRIHIYLEIFIYNPSFFQDSLKYCKYIFFNRGDKPKYKESQEGLDPELGVKLVFQLVLELEILNLIVNLSEPEQERQIINTDHVSSISSLICPEKREGPNSTSLATVSQDIGLVAVSYNLGSVQYLNTAGKASVTYSFLLCL